MAVNWVRLVLTAFAGFAGEPFYAQISLTLGFGIYAFASLVCLHPRAPDWLQITRGRPSFSPTKDALLFFVVCLSMAGLNEFIRINGSLEIWVWFYAFSIVEAMLAALVAVLAYGATLGAKSAFRRS